MVKKPKKIFECWVKENMKVSSGADEDIITALLVPNHNFGKDECIHSRGRLIRHGIQIDGNSFL
jgi:hypothetical protein